MAKLQLSDNLLDVPSLSLHYAGPNPQHAYEEVKRLLPLIFKVPAERVQEREFSWDRSRAEEKFKMSLELRKDLDPFSFASIKVKLSGFAKPSEEFGKEGEVEVELSGSLCTEFPQDTSIQRLLGMFFLFRMHERRLKRYKAELGKQLHQLYEQLRAFFNLLPKRG